MSGERKEIRPDERRTNPFLAALAAALATLAAGKIAVDNAKDIRIELPKAVECDTGPRHHCKVAFSPARRPD